MDELEDDRLTLVGLLVESYKGLTGTLERRLERDSGLSLQWFEVLLRLSRSPGHRLRMTDLAAQTGLTPSGLTRSVDRLTDAGLVVRVACPEDRRVAYAALTPVGLDRVRAAVRPHVSDIDELIAPALAPGERDDLERLLRKLRDHVNPQATVVTPADADEDGADDAEPAAAAG